MARGDSGGGAMALGLSWAVLSLWPQLQLSSWSGLCGKEGQESESRTPISGGGKWAGPVDRETVRDSHRCTGDRQARTSVGRPRGSREGIRWTGKPAFWRVHTRACKHSFIHSFTPYIMTQYPPCANHNPGLANTAGNKMDKTPCLHRVYILIIKQKNNIKKYSVLGDKGFGGKLGKRGHAKTEKTTHTHQSSPGGERNKGETPGHKEKEG